MPAGKLYIVATPIGNLQDITLRALEILKMVDIVLCEDTRVTRNLLSHFEISTPTMSYHEHSDEKKVHEILNILQEGKHVALVTDAGTPGISDPGNRLVESIAISQDPIKIIPIPGSSAIVTALSISGFPTDRFIFMGFPPHKKGRETYFKKLARQEYTVVFYESNHRIKKCLDNLAKVLDNDRQVCVCRELTKKFETIYRGTITEILEMDVKDKGEFVVIVKNDKLKEKEESL
ncbi:MAG: 16S rRNA (cytidine(1402)-2'-O)-methyltransferase [Candidatus Magasanikbacteria bacterium CG_4_10_14_0_2_um_filter_37_12]|uniref:Ribosomal RNA small subunit methyltransferase I n=1 Tax=Candidatus Magasanikbacteria bacterium CG_4_10_14_0_2_um_filter_37_12 TaxID=1974637 RepID=A0A2M7V7Z9_9BACT|nr:MAG: 16S rRNA (cytidine(1402)-2'-O)-methyltransferase [Candidatus Magasanikbacteria bacterium CG_4_10_14_0_2_um_filter_37_12]